MKKIAFITGATRGIGMAIAKQLGQAGFIVVGTATTLAGVEHIQQYLSALNIEGTGILFDLMDGNSFENALDFIQKKYGTISTLVNNAAITKDQLLIRMRDEEWETVIQANLTAVAKLTRLVLKPMLKAKQGGQIIQISSVVAQMGNAGQSNYAAAKAGLIGFSRALAREVGSRQITVNVVTPGFIETQMTADLPEAQRAAVLAQIPLGTFGKPEDVAAAVAFLASPAARYITGAVLPVNGGFYMA